jgi:ActD protein
MTGATGCLFQMKDEASLRAAVHRLQGLGLSRLDAYTPYEVDGLADALGRAPRRIPLLMLLGGIVGGGITLFMEYWSAVVDYPLNVGGRPNASWPAFAPAAIEMTILFAVLAGVAGMLRGSGLPKLYHPVFNVDWFDAASRDGFLLFVDVADPAYDVERLVRILDDHGLARWQEVQP